jgi:DNA-binding Lrp family transcriptional regulator
MVVKIDLKDRKILYELDLDSRQSNKQIARKVGLSEQVIGNRIKRLIELKVIEYFYVKINPALLGYLHVRIFLRLHNITKQKEEELISQLNHEKGVFWLCSLRGKYDLTCSLGVKNMFEFSKRYEEIFARWGDYILNRNIVLVEKADIFPKKYLWPQQKPQSIIYTKGSEEKQELSDFDLGLLSLLNKNGRLTLIELGRKLNASSDTVNYHISNLRKRGIITGFGAKIDFNQLGNSFYLISIKMQNMNNEKYLKLQTLSKFNKNIIYFIKALGDHDIDLELETSSKEELDQLIKSLRDNFVTEIKDYEILEVIKEHHIYYYSF